MVEDRVTDGKRIGQLLASELTGLDRGPLGSVSVVDADPDVEPTPEGALAYRLTAGEASVGTVSVTPSTARLELVTTVDPELPDYAAVTVEQTDSGTVLIAHSGAAVKQLVDVIAATLRSD
ncbi:hypothetical protein ACFQL1_15560 [Halomicroarcula sp. GCM10025709]|uniref:hypothetical protein n=1 Tax=Haloarcula TaxID=2237 RepID=UPI0024C46BC2|nr:hypothetical protein [Halomicroarcula sp. YJ-61-S]